MDFLEKLAAADTPTYASTITAPIQGPVPAKPQKRCGACKHKLALSDMPCKCGIRHCSAHRLPEDHACSFNHGGHDRLLLEAAAIKCVADKLEGRL